MEKSVSFSSHHIAAERGSTAIAAGGVKAVAPHIGREIDFHRVCDAHISPKWRPQPEWEKEEKKSLEKIAANKKIKIKKKKKLKKQTCFEWTMTKKRRRRRRRRTIRRLRRQQTTALQRNLLIKIYILKKCISTRACLMRSLLPMHHVRQNEPFEC